MLARDSNNFTYFDTTWHNLNTFRLDADFAMAMLLKRYSLKLKAFLAAATCCLIGSAAAQTAPTTPSDEQVLAYIASYPDLVNAFGVDVNAGRQHYIYASAAESRSIKFNAYKYIASYPDLITVFGSDTEMATRHYIRNGAKQNRRITFDGLAYIASNMSLIGGLGTDEDAAARHYVTYGYGAGLKTNSFSALQYIASYTDLIVAFGKNAMAGLAHYISQGFKENRVVTFNATQYINNYTDIKAAFGANTQAATIHYITDGLKENRTDAKANRPPVVEIMPSFGAGYSTTRPAVALNTSISIFANASDADGDRLTYVWTFESKPENSTSTIGSATTTAAAFVPDKPGLYVLRFAASDGKVEVSKTVDVRGATPVSGNLSGSVTWDKSQAPYIQVGRVGVPAGSSLTIPAGVELFGNGNLLQIQGALTVEGLPGDRARLTGINVQGAGTSASPGQTAFTLKIKNAEVQGTLINSSSAIPNLSIEDSRLDLAMPMYIYSYSSVINIQRTYFVNSSMSLSLPGYSGTPVVLKNNSFSRMSGLQLNGASYVPFPGSTGSAATIDITLNTFRQPSYTGGYVPPLNGYSPIAVSSTGQSIALPNNYWGTVDSVEIGKMISDGNDDLNNYSFVNFAPPLAAADPRTPLE